MHDQVAAYRSFDGPYMFTGANGVEGRCYLSVYEHRGSLPVVIACELASNRGVSITNAAAALATQVWRQLLPDAKEGLRWIEAYSTGARRADAPTESFAEVTFDLDSDALHSPRWYHLERADVEALIGGPVSLAAETSY